MDRLWNANYIKVWMTNFLMNFAFMLIVPLLPLYLADTYGASKDTIGMVLFGYALAALCMRPFSGWIVDSFPRKAILLFFLSLTTFFFLGYLAAGSLIMFAMFRTLHGAPFGAMGVSLSTVAVDVLPSSRRTEGIGYYGLSNNIATAISPTVAILIFQRYPSYDLLFLLCFCVSLLGILLCSTLRLKPNVVAPNPQIPTLSLDRFFLIPAWALFLTMFTLGISYSIMSTYVAIYGREQLNISSGTGGFFGLLALGLIVSRLTGANALRLGLVVRNANIGFIFSLCGYILFALSSADMLISDFHIGERMTGTAMDIRVACYFLAPFVIGLGNGHTWPAFQNMFINLAEHNQRGTANSTILTAWDLGMGAGMLLGGLLTEFLGYSQAFWIIVLLNASGAAFYYLFARGHYLRHRLR